MEQLDIVVNFLQCVQALGHFLDSRLILPQPRGLQEKASLLSLSFNHQAGLISYPKLCLACFLELQGLRQTLRCSFTVTPPHATPTDRSSIARSSTARSSTAFSHRKYKTPVQGWCKVNKTGLRFLGKDFCFVVTCFYGPCPEDQDPLTSFTMDLMSLLASCRSSGFLLFSSLAKSWERRHLK